MRKLTLALIATLALGGLTTYGLAKAQNAPAAYAVFPVPGTLTASAKTQLSFRGGPPASIGTVTVTGSSSGAHTGTLKPHSDGLGASFVPDKPFTAGEKVTVRSGAHADYSFMIGAETRRALRPVEDPAVGRGSVQSYRTRPDLTPPAVTVTTNKPGVAPGLVFLAPKAGRGQDGPMIIDNAGRLVWFKAMKGKIAADFRVQAYQGKPVLTWWEGQLYVGDGDGVGQIYDSSYKRVGQVRAGNGYSFDLHEFTITPRNTALVIAYERYNRSLKAWHGPSEAKIVDNIVQEIDLATGLVLFEWHSFGNVSPDESGIPVPKNKGSEWEYFHANAVDLDNDGNYLVSARNTSAVYKIDRTTGKILWRLGGKKSDFKLGPGVRFDWQHSIRAQPDGTYKLYDNSAAPAVRKSSRVLTIKLDTDAKTATLVSAFKHPRGLLSASQGNVERLPNGNVFVGWGSQRWFTEFSPSGQVLFDGRLARGNDNYRAFRYEWTGRPAQPPKLIASTSGGTVSARVSWNGATGVARWELLAGADANSLAPIASAPSAGFETALQGATSAAVVAARAYDASGQVLGTSTPVRPTSS
ncbi:MAG TPA: arylsulfotransferase family protein [Solirubrobacter sp.]|nr:arylsulfotransferase family protein [Solirubrobacter sp.]